MLSIIVPVYNAENYLHNSLDCILKQTYRDFEVVLVNDGLTDNSGQICDVFAQRDSRVHVIHQKNAGAGAACNAGIKTAKGEYIVFVDSDDMIEPDYMELLSKHNEDLVFIDVDRVD